MNHAEKGAEKMGFHSFRLKPGAVLGFLGALVLVAMGAVFFTSEEPLALPVWSLFKRAESGETAEERLGFLRENGWEADEEPMETREVTIPSEFDERYEQYNALQESQGFSLAPFAGKKVTEYTYHITNYPDNDEVAAHLLVYKGKIIGADISAMEQDGFMEGVKRPAAD